MAHPNSKEYRGELAARRIAAETQGKHTFERQTPCPSGHYTRYVSNGHCAICQTQANSRRYFERKEKRNGR